MFFFFNRDKIYVMITTEADVPLKEEDKMKINFEQTYLSSAAHRLEMERQLAVLEEKLKTPERTVEDIVRHIELLKEYKKSI